MPIEQQEVKVWFKCSHCGKRSTKKLIAEKCEAACALKKVERNSFEAKINQFLESVSDRTEWETGLVALVKDMTNFNLILKPSFRMEVRMLNDEMTNTPRFTFSGRLEYDTTGLTSPISESLRRIFDKVVPISACGGWGYRDFNIQLSKLYPKWHSKLLLEHEHFNQRNKVHSELLVELAQAIKSDSILTTMQQEAEVLIGEINTLQMKHRELIGQIDSRKGIYKQNMDRVLDERVGAPPSEMIANLQRKSFSFG